MPATSTVRAGTLLAVCLSAALLCSAAFAGDDDLAPSSAVTLHLTTFQAASAVIGQVDFTSHLQNQGGSAAADTIADPYGNIGLSGKGVLYVPDLDNNRVLGFPGIPSTNGADADFALGQPDLTNTVFGNGANQMKGPETVVAFKKMLLVDDYNNSRILIWKTAPKVSGTPADVVVGQAGFGMGGLACAAVGFSQPESIAVAKGKLIVGDSSNNRVLIWKKIPKTNGRPPDLVLGQNNLTTCVENNDGTGTTGAPSTANFTYPAGVWTNGTKLVVADANNNRILIWKKFPKHNFQPADVVLGQLDFTTNAKNNDGAGGVGTNSSASSLFFPYYLTSNGSQLVVADDGNFRVLVWNSFPTADFQAANVVLGQPTFTCHAKNNDGTGCVSGTASANNMGDTRGVSIFKNQLIVTDGSNNRYLIFN